MARVVKKKKMRRESLFENDERTHLTSYARGYYHDAKAQPNDTYLEMTIMSRCNSENIPVFFSHKKEPKNSFFSLILTLFFM